LTKKYWLFTYFLIFSIGASPIFATDNVPVSHFLYSKSGEFVELEDGSLWSINPSNKKTLQSWSPGDPLILAPTSSSALLGYPYYISNRNTESYIYVSLHQKPLQRGANTFEISYINPNSGNVTIYNGESHCGFIVNSKDFPLLHGWEVANPILVGLNDNWIAKKDFLWKHNFILVNLEKNNFVKASLENN